MESIEKLPLPPPQRKGTTIAIVADMHLGRSIGSSLGVGFPTEIVTERMIASFYELLLWARDNGKPLLIFAGDAFDKPLIAPKYIAKIKGYIREFWEQGIRCVFVTGNHDCNRESGNALSYIEDTWTTVVKEPSVCDIFDPTYNDSIPIAFAPYVYGKSAQDVLLGLKEKIKDAYYTPRLLVGHFGVYGTGYAKKYAKKDPMAVHVDWLYDTFGGTGVEVIAIGHYHQSYQRISIGDGWSLEIDQIGAFNPTGFGDSGTSYGNILSVPVTKEPLCGELITGAISGVRYASCDSDLVLHSNEIGSYKRSWFLAKSHVSFPDELSSLKSVDCPGDLSEVISGAKTLIAGKETSSNCKFVNNSRDMTVSTEDSIQKFVSKNVDAFNRSSEKVLGDSLDIIGNGCIGKGVVDSMLSVVRDRFYL